MDVGKAITDMEASLKARGISTAELCRRAEIAETTWGRWKKKTFSPQWEPWTRVQTAFADLTTEPAHVSAPAQLHPALSTAHAPESTQGGANPRCLKVQPRRRGKVNPSPARVTGRAV